MNDRMQELKLSDLKEKLENRKSGERLVKYSWKKEI